MLPNYGNLLFTIHALLIALIVDCIAIHYYRK